jgi:lysozyme family protein
MTARILNLSSSAVVAGAAPRALQSASTPKLCTQQVVKPVKIVCAATKGDQAPQPAPTDQNTPANPLQAQQQQQQQSSTSADPAIWCQGIAGGTFFQEVHAVLPPVQWTPADLVQVQAGIAVHSTCAMPW